MTTEGTVVALFCVATTIAIAVRRVRIPYTVALVIAGIGLGGLELVDPPRLTRDLLFTFFLPGLLFEAAFHIDLGELRRMWRSILVLAVPGVALSVAATAALVKLGWLIGVAPDLGLWPAVTFAAVVAATDPVAVTALFREIGAPSRLATLVEAESLFNDGTGVVFLALVLSAATSGGSVASAVPSFFLIAGGGVVFGAVIGFVVSTVIHHVDDPMIEIALTMIAAFGSFVLAESVGASGVLATVVAGIVCASHGRERGMTEISREAATTFWRYVGFALNSIVFLLIGLEVRASSVAAQAPAILIGFAAMTIARFLLVGVLHLIFRRTSERLPTNWSMVLAWGGLRGALGMVLALSLPSSLAHRDAIVSMTVGAVIASLLLQGLTMPIVVRKLLPNERVG